MERPLQKMSRAPEIIPKGVSVAFTINQDEIKQRNLLIWPDHDVTPYSEWKEQDKSFSRIFKTPDGDERICLAKPLGGIHSTALASDRTDFTGQSVCLRFYKTDEDEVVGEMAVGDFYGITLSEQDVKNMYSTFKNLARSSRVNIQKGKRIHSRNGFELPKKILYRNRNNEDAIWVAN